MGEASDYRLFVALLEDTWHGLKIQHFERDHGKDRNEFSLLIREGRFTSEVSWHGHGLQAWLQTIWFLARTSKGSTIVLDEPDVYLHADLQRKLIKVIEGLGFQQAIIATHSSEIIGDVPFQNVVVIQKQERISRSAENANQIQDALKGMGSLHSIQMSKVAQRGLILFVEGDDRTFLSDIAYKLGSRIFDSFSKIAVQELKGKGNWTHALGAAKALAVASGGQVQTALLLDSDYMLINQRIEFYNKAIDTGLILKIWRKKEIENYLINASLIARYINLRFDGPSIETSDVENLICEIEADLKNGIILCYTDVVQKASSTRIEPTTAYKRAEEIILTRLENGTRISDLASGKEFIGALSTKLHKLYDVNITPLGLCKELRESEIDPELRYYVTQLCSNGKIDLELFSEREEKEAA